MTVPPAVLEHAAVPIFGRRPLLRPVPRRTARVDRLAWAARMLAAGVVCLELDLWPTVAAVRAAGLEGGDGDRFTLARPPVPLDSVLRRLGRGSEGFYTACRAYTEAVWKCLHLAPVPPKEGGWGLAGWLDGVLDLLPRPLPACVAQSLWGLAAEPLQAPEPGEVRCWMVANE